MAPWAASERRAGIALVALFGVVYGVLAATSFRAFPFSGDEYSSYLQAEIFATGALSAPAPPHSSLFHVDHVIIDDRVRSKYPPGSAALLLPGTLAGVPWLVTPLEGLLALVFLRQAARLSFGDGAAFVTVFVAGISPIFMFNAASFFSHAPVSMCLALALASIARFGRDGGRGWLLLTGAAVGLALLTRPLDAVVFAGAIPLLRRWRRVIPWVALGALPAVGLLLAYQRAQFGGAFIDGYRVYEPMFRSIYGDRAASPNLRLGYLFDPEQSWQHLERLRALLVDWMPPGAAVAFVVGAIVVPRETPGVLRLRDFACGLVVLTVVVFLTTWVMGDDGPPTRYLSQMVMPIALFAGPGWLAIERQLVNLIGALWSRSIGLLLAAHAVVMFVSVASTRLPRVLERQGLYREVEARGLHDAIVVVKARHPTRYTRNGPTFDRSVLFVRPDIADTRTLLSWFPGRAVYEVNEDSNWTIHAAAP